MAARMPSDAVTGGLVSHGVQPVHDVVDAPAEVVVQLRVLGVEAVVAVVVRLVGQADAGAPAAAAAWMAAPSAGAGALAVVCSGIRSAWTYVCMANAFRSRPRAATNSVM